MLSSFEALKLFPRRCATLCMGFLADRKVSPALLGAVIKLYGGYYRVNFSEAADDVSSFRSFNEFFTRKLRPGVRPLDNSPEALISPVDGTVAECGEFDGDALPQAKGIRYSLGELIGRGKSRKYEGGAFLTIYLSPRDYHRIHSPCDGSICEVSHFSGDYWPVNELGVQNVAGLFALNERVVSFLKTGKGPEIAVVKVGALIVGKIRLSFADPGRERFKGQSVNRRLEQPFEVKKGDELGRFELGGSTVILIFPPGKIRFSPNVRPGASLCLGEKIGEWLAGEAPIRANFER